MNDAKQKLGLDQPGIYEIQVPGRLDESWSEWFEGMTITVESGDDGPTITTLTGVVVDEAALQGMLDRLYSLGLRLLSVKRLETSVQSRPKGKSGEGRLSTPASVPPREYDFVIAGGGVAGLSLAHHMIRSHLGHRSILIIDRDAKEQNDRTLSFWTDRPTPFDDIVHRSWSQLRFVGEHLETVVELEAYRYKMIRGVDFYRFVRQQLSAHPNVEFLQGTVDHIGDGDERASVSVGGQTYSGQWVFDSRFDPDQFGANSGRYHSLRWHFKVWLIETRDALFNPLVATPFDFRTPQDSEMRFFYVLPLSERQALVEYALHSQQDYDQALRIYLETVLGIQDYRILAEEAGTIPMTDQPLPRRAGRRVMTIGTLGGRVKPSSGYAFMRIQHDSEAIIESLLQAGHPFDVPPDSSRHRFYDSLMLQVMSRRGEQVKGIFTALVKNNPIERVFRFLDETSSPGEDLRFMASVPTWPFLQALFRLKVLRKV